MGKSPESFHDVALVPLNDIRVRFTVRTLYDEDFVIVTRKGRPLGYRLSMLHGRRPWIC